MLSRMFNSHYTSIPKKSIRPLAYELQTSIAKKVIRPLAYESQKSIRKKAIRPLAYASQKRAETNKRPSASSSASQKRAETKKRPLALDSEKRAVSEKRAKTEKTEKRGKMKKQSPLISVQEEDLRAIRHTRSPCFWFCPWVLFILCQLGLSWGAQPKIRN